MNYWLEISDHPPFPALSSFLYMIMLFLRRFLLFKSYTESIAKEICFYWTSTDWKMILFISQLSFWFSEGTFGSIGCPRSVFLCFCRWLWRGCRLPNLCCIQACSIPIGRICTNIQTTNICPALYWKGGWHFWWRRWNHHYLCYPL